MSVYYLLAQIWMDNLIYFPSWTILIYIQSKYLPPLIETCK